MSKLERFFIVGLGVLVVLAVVIIFVGPRLVSQPPSSERPLALGETETMAARVIEVLEEGSLDMGDGMEHPYQRLLVRVEGGSLAGEEVVVEEGTINIVSQERLFDYGDRVYLERVAGVDGNDRFYISDPVRTTPLLLIAALFVGLVVLTGRRQGLRSLLGTLFSLLVLFFFVLPQIVAGRDPVLVCIVGSIALLAVSTYVIYGWNFKAHAAVVGMMSSILGITASSLLWLLQK